MLDLAVRAPALEIAAFVATWPSPLGALPPHDQAAPPPDGLTGDEATRTAIRAALRAGGYKPSGRGKPATRYSLATGLPISVVDADLVTAPLAIEVAAAGTRYVFNPSGQEIDASGLAVLVDAAGPSGSAVKDAQRTKTHADTRRTLSIVWGARALPGRAAAVATWYRALAEAAGADVAPCRLT